ncbi:MAG: hypothetical protein IKT38_03710 [Clostridia bacterium]|nr:hypothetical protein [Clostridia bacterium]
MGLILSASGCEKEKAVVDVKPIIKPENVAVETVSLNETATEDEQVTEFKYTEPEKEEPPAQNMEIVVSESEPEAEPTEPKPENVENNEKRELSFLDKESPVEIEIVPIAPQVVNASAQDSKEIAEKILEYINSYRTIKAMKLEGLTEYAEYRSRQLIKRFAHNTEDERAAATALQYGEYVDPSLYGMNGEPYYTSCSREAIAKAGYAGTADEIAKRFADLIKNSAKHWAYVGADEYSYIAVGVTYESGMWYCDVAVAKENTDNK